MSTWRARGRSATRRAARVVLPMAGGPFRRTSLTMVRCCRAEGRPAALVGNRFESVQPADQLLLPGCTHARPRRGLARQLAESSRHTFAGGVSERRGEGPVGRVLYRRLRDRGAQRVRLVAQRAWRPGRGPSTALCRRRGPALQHGRQAGIHGRSSSALSTRVAAADR
jgi:hypothetical protein